MSDSGLSKNRWLLVVAAWALVAALLAFRTIAQFGAVPLLGDSDDAMRIVTATDLLDGQGWQDSIQHRDNAPFGVELHWSRLVDAPIALLLAIARPLTGILAPDIAAIVWPLLLLLPLLALAAVIVRKLVPVSDGVTALALPLISLVLLIEFLPGRVDHHNVQILLMMAAMAGLILWRDRVVGGVVVGIALAASLAIGLETLPFIAVGIAAMVLFWTIDPERYWAATVSFGVTLAVGTLAHFLIATAPSRYGVAACDMISIVYVAAMGLGGLALAAVAALAATLRSPVLRLVAMGAAGAVVVGVCALQFPGCLAGPYATVDPRIDALLFAGIAEVQPLWRRLIDDPATGIAFGLPALAAVAIAVQRCLTLRGKARADWLIAGGFLLAAVLVMLVQIRGARFAGAFAIPGAAALITAVRTAYVARPTAARMAGLLGSWLLFAGVLQFAVVGWLVPRSTAATSPFADVACFRAADYAQLAALPPANVMAPVRIGSHILRYTGHSVVSASFHRNNAGTLDTLDFFGSDDAAARAIADTRQIGIVADCNNANALVLTEREWLTALPGGGTLSLYSVNLQ